MVTVINNPPSGNTGNETGGGGMGIVIGIILVIIAIFLFFMFGWPALKGKTGGGGYTPANNGATYNVPDKIDVNVQKK